jgi:hypothetical protein
VNAQAFTGGLVGRPSFAYFSWPSRKVGRLPGATGKVFVFNASSPRIYVFSFAKGRNSQKLKGLRPLATPYSFCSPEKE